MAFAAGLITIAMMPIPLVFFLRYFKIIKLESDIPTVSYFTLLLSE